MSLADIQAMKALKLAKKIQKDMLTANMTKYTASNLVKNSSIVDTTDWTFSLSSGSVSDNKATATATAKFGSIQQTLLSTPPTIGDKYYYGALVKADTNQVQLELIKNTGDFYSGQIHSGNGQEVYLSGIATILSSSTNLRLRVIDYRTSNFTPFTLSEPLVINLTTLFGVGNEPSKTEFESLLATYNNNKKFFPQTLDVYQKQKDPANPLIYVNKTGDNVQVISKYSVDKDMRITLNKRGVNNIFDFIDWYLIDNVTAATSKDTSGGTLFHSNNTDWVGPHVVKVVSNVTGEQPTSSYFTGGNHGYDNTGSTTNNSPTGRTIEILLFVDGRKVGTNYSGYGANLDIYWTNRVQATNTTKFDGTGREVLEERFHYHFDGDKWFFDREIEFLEAVTWETYYGIQCNNAAWNESVFYHSSLNRKKNTVLSTDSTSGDKNCNLVTLKKGTHYLDMAIDSTIGLGRKEFVSSNDVGAFTASYSKTYYNLVKGTSPVMAAGDIVTYRGHYRFYSK